MQKLLRLLGERSYECWDCTWNERLSLRLPMAMLWALTDELCDCLLWQPYVCFDIGFFGWTCRLLSIKLRLASFFALFDA